LPQAARTTVAAERMASLLYMDQTSWGGKESKIL
jgi:hypothetical protein